MPRAARTVSKSGIYHVMLRGEGRQLLFEDDDERAAFLSSVEKYRDDLGFVLLAWCLMDNHVHFLIQADMDVLSDAMKRIETTHAVRHNAIHSHVGHVFAGRFKSEAVETDAYLLAVARYIHLNPETAGICRAADYPWSSYGEYVGKPALCDTSTVLDMLGGPRAFAKFIAEGACDPAVDPDPFSANRRLTNDEAAKIAQKVLGGDPQNILEGLSRKRRDERLAVLKEAGLSIRQTERITGVGRSAVARAFAEA